MTDEHDWPDSPAPGDAPSSPAGPGLDLTPGSLAKLSGEIEATDAKPVARGPKPRSMLRPRIQVKSDVSSARVRSSRLQPKRREMPVEPEGQDAEGGPNPLSDIETTTNIPQLKRRRAKGGEDSPEGSTRLLMPLQVLAALLLFEAAVLPAVRAEAVVAPWVALTDPASPNFVAATFLALMALLFVIPMSRTLRTGLGAGVALLLVLFSLVLLRSALSSSAFDGQPALRALFGQGYAPIAIVTLAACVLPAGLCWRHVVPHSVGARVGTSIGIALALFAFLGLHLLSSLEGTPVGLLSGPVASEFVGDSIAATLAWAPLLATMAAAAVWLPGRLHGFAGPLAIATWFASALPLMTLALFVAPAERWHDALLPVQTISLLSAGTLLAAVCLGHLLAFVEAKGDGPPP